MQTTPVTVASLMALYLATVTLAYPEGPPADSCTTMFPEGHPADALTKPHPFRLALSTATYTPGSAITVTMESTDNVTFYEGVFVQARRADCGNHDNAVGTWSVPDAQRSFLQTMNCTHPMGALAHRTSAHKFNHTAEWTAPNTDVGAIYFRGTFVFHEDRYWMNVFSDVVNTDSTFTGYCPVQMVRSVTPTPTSSTTDSTAGSTTVSSGKVMRGVGFVQIVVVMVLAMFLRY